VDVEELEDVPQPLVVVRLTGIAFGRPKEDRQRGAVGVVRVGVEILDEYVPESEQGRRIGGRFAGGVQQVALALDLDTEVAGERRVVALAEHRLAEGAVVVLEPPGRVVEPIVERLLVQQHALGAGLVHTVRGEQTGFWLSLVATGREAIAVTPAPAVFSPGRTVKHT